MIPTPAGRLPARTAEQALRDALAVQSGDIVSVHVTALTEVLAELGRLQAAVRGARTQTDAARTAAELALTDLGAEVDRLRPIEARARNLVTINERMTSRTARVILGEDA